MLIRRALFALCLGTMCAGCWVGCSSPANPLKQGPKVCAVDGDCPPGTRCISNFCIVTNAERPVVVKEAGQEPGADGAKDGGTPKEGEPPKDGGTPKEGEPPKDDTEVAKTEEPAFEPPPIEQSCTDEDKDGFCADNDDPSLKDCDDKNKDVYPGAKELCNGKDDNCNGQIDESFAEEGDSCQTTQAGVCAKGGKKCTAGKVTCEALNKPSEELCDGEDNDCDGEIDESPKGAGDKCSTGQPGICADGTQTCENGAFVCKPQKQAQQEVCDGVDNDCDGSMDEPPCSCQDGQTQACYTGATGTAGIGTCLEGKQTCTSGAWGTCQGEVTPVKESCDGKDNDCDGQTDEEFPGEGDACQTSQPGICATGKKACKAGKVECAPDNLPTQETCNQQDDDCDGQTDEDGVCGACKDNDKQNCYSGPPGTSGVGECQKGTQTCTGGNWGTCIGEVAPLSEVCDGKDNDCNGQVDDDFAGKGDTCNTGKPGICAAGKKACNKGKEECTPDNQPGTETCNGKDDDCDGQTDENAGCMNCQANETRKCYSGTPGTAGKGICVEGTQTCQGGSWGNCTGEVLPQTEVCNGKDDNCDGQIDEGVAKTYYRDKDGDKYGDPNDSQTACSAPTGYIEQSGDCDDDNKDVFPGQSNYFSAARTGGSFDYNCNQQEEKEFEVGGCSVSNNQCVTRQGYVNTNGSSDGVQPPACGVEGTFLVECIVRSKKCVPNNNNLTKRLQTCR